MTKIEFLRLNVFIARTTGISRRKSDSQIKQGKVTVNGQVVVEPYRRLHDSDTVRLESRRLFLPEHVYLKFNKPRGVTTTRYDVYAKKTVMDCLPKKYSHLVPAGRLDKDSTGLLLLTNDGQLCYQLTHPSFGIEKEYELLLGGCLSLALIKRAKSGIIDKKDHLRVKSVKVKGNTKNDCLCRVIISEGKKRHLRRLFNGLGLKVFALKRLRLAKLSLGSLKPGDYVEVKKESII